jgi:phenylacetate-CoA ligase
LQNYQFLKESESWDLEQFRNWQFQKVKAVIECAYTSVPYYQKLFRKIGFEIGDFKSLDDLQMLPTVSKLDIKNNLADFISTNINLKDTVKDHTSGSTGHPMVVYSDREKAEIELSFFYYIWEKYGYKIGEPCIYIKGDKLVSSNRQRLHRHDQVYNYLRFDPDYLNRIEYLKLYDGPIRKFGAKVIFGYPSNLFQLAKAYVRANIKPPQFDLALLASENIYNDQFEFIKDVFKVKKIFFHYGHTEKVLLAFKHFGSNYLGFVPQYGYFELLDAKGRTVTQEDEIGEIVGTGYSKCMPFIRYRTTDFAKHTNYQCDGFMKNYRHVKNIEGRLQEFIVTKDNRLVSMCTICAAHFKMMSGVIETQYYQDKEGEIIFRVVPSPQEPLDDQKIARIRKAMEEKFEHTIDVKVQIVENIPKTALNKKIMVEQKLNISQYLS